MSFDFSTLITDRTQADVSRVQELASKIRSGTASESELAEFNSAAMKGAYNHTDLNRVTAAMNALKSKLEGYGYAVPGYQRIKVPHVLPESEPTSRLPEGYTELTYIESTGTQYIDTNYIPASETLKIYAKSAISKIQSWKSMFGSENGENGPWSLIAITNDSSKLVFYTCTSAGVGSIPVTAGQVYELTCQTANGILTYNCGSTTGSVAVSGSVNKAQTLYVFTQHSHSASDTANQAISMKLYDCKIYDNGTLVRDFVPCKDSSGVYGLYDMVSAKFYGNAGTGAFTAGEEIAPPADVPAVDEFDPYLWYEFDWPTPATMTLYLLNVSAIRAVLGVMASTPQVPDDMVGLMVTAANDIEVILMDVYRQINIMATTFIPCGEALCGGDNL